MKQNHGKFKLFYYCWEYAKNLQGFFVFFISGEEVVGHRSHAVGAVAVGARCPSGSLALA